jgi:hypothetical protein
MDHHSKKEVQRRTDELRVAPTRSSTTPRRLIYLAVALQKMIESYPRSAFPETWEVLDSVMNTFNRVTAAQAIFDAEVIDGTDSGHVDRIGG